MSDPQQEPVKEAEEIVADERAEHGFTAIFVRRPIMALVFNALIVVAGLAAYFGVEVRELPDVDQPVITVRTTFSGASPETVDREVTDVIEGAVARVSGLSSMSSNSQTGSSRVTLEFNKDTDINVASMDVRDAVGRIQGQLPEDADEPRIVKADSDAQPILRLAITSSVLDIDDLTKYVSDTIEDRLAAVPGVADVAVYGERDKIFRIDINQAALASRGLTVADLGNALSDMSWDVPAGALTSTTQALGVRATADLTTPEDFADLLISDNVRLGDVATVVFGPDTAATALRYNGQPGIGLGIIRQAKSNTLDISQGVRNVVAEIEPNLPEGTTIKISSDDAVFISGSIDEVVRSLLLASLIVVAIIFLFLRDWRATIIPAITLPVALVGTMAAIYLAGFSINILTLLAIVLATGMVVDDAIVVLENIVRLRALGMGPRAAAVLGTKQVFFAVITTTATLAAVFVPLSFLPGQAGGLFREFGFVLAFAVMLSSFVALTLCPMLASRILVQHKEARAGLLTRAGNGFNRFYARTLSMALSAPLVVLSFGALLMFGAYLAYANITSELLPSEDRSMLMMRVSAPEGVSLDYTRDRIQQVEETLQPLIESGEIESVFSISGFGSNTNSGFMVMTLAPWAERERVQSAIANDVNRAAGSIPAVRAFAFQPNSLNIRGGGNGLSVALVGSTHEKLSAAASAIVAAMEADPMFDAPRLSNDASQAQLSLSLDRRRASDLGIDIAGLSQALRALLEGRSVGEVFIDGEAYDVQLRSDTRKVDDPTDLQNIFLKTGDGRIVPLSTIATLEEKSIAPTLERENQLAAVSLSSSLAPGVALGDAYQRLLTIAEPLLPEGAHVEAQAEAAALGENASGMSMVFGFAIIIVFLVLAAQFESVWSSLIILATVPFGIGCAVIAMLITGTTLNIYSQIGLVLLIGVMAKNGILIVEFANQLRDRGEGVRDAIEHATLLRLRPVMMTMISTVLGGIPLVMASGAGAEARVALGWVIVGGLGLATIITLYITPVAYLILARFSKPKADEERRLNAEMRDAGLIGHH
ncbi:efflux RND transporter permease subunit [Martelella limonii]|uniref:efflux RND transporter permease subunit n=1 Tax=Martelella limonii TaxID=1647649 RepID=UPI0018857544|nr:efflux RND transporter permease subunit [Martelella limonii]